VAEHAADAATLRLTFELASDPEELRPEEEKTVGGDAHTGMESSRDGALRQVCVYSGMLATLSRPVSAVEKVISKVCEQSGSFRQAV
jgi:hypothetical protein